MGCYGSWVRGRSGGSCRASILPYQTCHRRFQQWVRSGALEKVLRKLAKRLQAEGRLNLEEAFIDATLCGGKKRGLGVGPTKRGKGTKITAIATGHSLPLAVSVQAASPHESQLVEEALGNSFLNELPAKLIGDKAYDSDPLDRVLWNTGGVHTVELYARVRRAVQAEGRSEREAARQFGLARETVRKMLRYSIPPGYRRQQPARRPKLDAWVGIIDQILEQDQAQSKKQRHTAKQVFERLREEHGFPGGYTIVKDYVRLRKLSQREMFVPLEHPPGDAQADFGEAQVVIGGVERKAHYFVMDLPQSDDCFVMAFPAETTEAFLEGHNLRTCF